MNDLFEFLFCPVHGIVTRFFFSGGALLLYPGLIFLKKGVAHCARCASFLFKHE